ncbi:COX15/CtaA family protein [Halomonas sp. ML-15]|uniref:COX15/CtaA family protein n=1 Tax=Halomonas sp. ML-15 TaxID=2773305 RepID=UPI001746046D|nr:COX15/CtaA family protein [Halomonas sp. ML-15]MBD3894285.1 COX15/CtaA family protein [Halomonas sp. ML-15]
MEKQIARLKLLRGLSLVGVVFTIVVILVGVWTRLVDAGLGCPDWPGCYGRLVVPDADTASLHSPDAPLETFKAWVEMIHRYIASGLGLLVLALVALAFPLRRLAGYPWRLTLVLLVVIILQGAFGAFTVTLKLWPQVVTLHLLGGLTVMLLFLWLYLRLRQTSFEDIHKPVAKRRMSPLWALVAALLVGQLALGGWTSSNYAGISCQGFPTCNGEWWPDMDWSDGFHLTQTVGPNYLHGQLHADARAAIHFGHRLGALALGVGLVLLAVAHWARRDLRPWMLGILGAYALQIALGIANVLLWLPLSLALAHTAGAVLLIVVMTLTYWRAGLTHSHESGHQQADNEKEWVHA